jgi:glucose-6-phosphate isomerase
MIKLNFDLLWKVSIMQGVNEFNLKNINSKLNEFLIKINQRDQDFYKILDDQKSLNEILEYAESVKGLYKNIVVLGIGGSALGASCLESALKPLFKKSEESPKLVVLDNIDPDLINDFQKSVEMKDCLFLVITKSGGTSETLAQFFYFKKIVEDQNLNWQKHFVFVTDANLGLLREIANENSEVKSFSIPEKVGGRFSVLSVVGLLPAALIGVDIRGLIKGAIKMRDNFLSTDAENNLAFQMAALQFLFYQSGKNINVFFIYSQKLLKLGDWYRQLLAESIGKKLNDRGEKVNVGITPVTALGATDQHSQNQLYNEGPDDKLYFFIDAIENEIDLEIPFPEKNNDQIQYLKNLSFGRLFKTEMEGNKNALMEIGRPVIQFQLEKLDEENLGAAFLLLEGAISFLAEFLEINAYDQPGVELSKIITKKLLL